MAAEDKKGAQAVILTASDIEDALREARMLAMTLLCERGGEAPCRLCSACRKIEAEIHPDLIIVRREKNDKGQERREITVDQIRAISKDAWIMPNEAARKVYVILDADKMNLSAQNAALKLLEEPPNGAVFILCAANAALLLPTVRSRCVVRRVVGAENAPDAESGERAEAFLRLLAAGDRLKLLRWCVKQEGMDGREAQSFFEALRALLAELLCLRRTDIKLDRRQLFQMDALSERCTVYLRANVSVKHIFGLLAADAPLGSGNRG